jgi:alpha-N-arabinofuranosidase
LTTSVVGAEAARTFRNPILAGFYPDPSICRVGDDYYLVHSSFEYFPGVPIFHSRDLVHWHQIGHVLSQESQLPLEKMQASGGIFAPTLRYHDGTFYLVTTNVWGGGNFYVTATDPAGPWSDPVWLDQEGIDPSLLFDDDGTVYYTRHVGMADGYLGQCRLDIETGKLQGEMQEIWRGTGGVWPEGPHLYKIDGRYYLMISEGGTSYDHRVTVARSDSPWGPFTPCPDNPILTHANRPDHPIQALGHADLVGTPAGWWAVFLGIRPQGGRFHHLGRETFLAPVTWTDDHWPVIGNEGQLELQMPAPKLPVHPWNEPPVRDDFDKPELGLAWNFLRNPREADWSISERPGYLRLRGSAMTLRDQDSPAFVGRRQTALECEVSTQLAFNPQHDNEEAGLVVRGNDENHFQIGITQREGLRQAFFRRVLVGKIVEPVEYRDLPAGDVILSIAAQPLEYEFFVRSVDGTPIRLGTAPTRDLSSEKIGGFTGAYFGMYATGNGQPSTTPADFAWFDYRVEKR